MRYKPTRFFIDTEFIERGGTRDLLSIALVREDGQSYYAEVEGVDLSEANHVVQSQVLPYLTEEKKTKDVIRQEIINFIAQDNPAWWGYYCTWDFVLLQDLFNGFQSFPWSKYCNELMQLRAMANHVKLPKQASQRHHALHDAIWTKESYDHVYGFYIKYLDRLIIERGK